MAAVEIPQEKISVESYQITSFKGIDMTSAPATVDNTRSPSAPNMIRDTPGKVRKRMGYEKVTQYGGSIHAHHVLKKADGTERELLHAGTRLIDSDGNAVWSDMNDARSMSVQLETKLYIVDGKAMLCYDGETVSRADASASIPTIVVGRAPDGGGEPLEPINLLSDGWREEFHGDGTSTAYQLSLDGLSDHAVEVQIMDAEGEWQSDYTEGSDFSVNRDTGIVNFVIAPSLPPVDGQDNVRITAYRDRQDGRDKINGCRFLVLYGVNGALDRIFVSGNPEYPNYDWYCGYNNPSMWGDLWYGVIGQDDAPISGYSVINNLLAAHKKNGANGSNVVLRNGTMSEDGEAQFQIVNTLQGEGAVAPYSFAVIGTEPVFLTEKGVYAISANDTTGERFAQNRSYYINKPLSQLLNKEDVFAFVYNDFYFLATENGIYLLDSLVKSYERGKPYSTYQYEAYYFPSISATTLWEKDGRLYFGTVDGLVCRFFENKEDIASYNDNGNPIEAWWEIPIYSGSVFWTNKMIRYVSAQLASATQTSVRFYAFVRNRWKLLKERRMSAQWFSWSNLQWSRFSWGNSRNQRTVGVKARLRKLDAAQLRIENSKLNESFGLYALGFEYVESGKYKER